jgi:hypothetical protein
MNAELSGADHAFAEAEVVQKFGLGRDEGDDALELIRNFDLMAHLVGENGHRSDHNKSPDQEHAYDDHDQSGQA